MNDYCLSFALRQPCEILLRSKGFAFISQGQLADSRHSPRPTELFGQATLGCH